MYLWLLPTTSWCSSKFNIRTAQEAPFCINGCQGYKVKWIFTDAVKSRYVISFYTYSTKLKRSTHAMEYLSWFLTWPSYYRYFTFRMIIYLDNLLHKSSGLAKMAIFLFCIFWKCDFRLSVCVRIANDSLSIFFLVSSQFIQNVRYVTDML